jgi:adenosylcobinamide-GDP ribazoletransferase
MIVPTHRGRRWSGLVAGFAVATGFLTRVPTATPQLAPGLLADAAWAFPLVGAGIGGVAALAYGLAQLLGLGVLPAALLAVAAGIAVTGALHEDGLADTADGFGGGADRAGKLAIMRDSRVGSFGALALVLSIALRAAALAAIGDAVHAGLALIAAHAASRAFLPAAMALLPPARADGLGATAGRPRPEVATLAAAVGAAIALLALGPWRGAAALGLAVAATLLAGLLARRQIGGYTGDVLGAFQQLGEIAMLLAASAR